MKLLLAFAVALAVVGGGFAIIYGQSAQAAPTHTRHHVHSADPIASLGMATLNHHEVALELGVAYESSGAFNVGDPAPPPMCEDCGGNHPQLYSQCDKCQNGTLAACLDQNGFYASCSCRCGYNNLCRWIRW